MFMIVLYFIFRRDSFRIFLVIFLIFIVMLGIIFFVIFVMKNSIIFFVMIFKLSFVVFRDISCYKYIHFPSYFSWRSRYICRYPS